MIGDRFLREIPVQPRALETCSCNLSRNRAIRLDYVGFLIQSRTAIRATRQSVSFS